jgi:hypothetical protein
MHRAHLRPSRRSRLRLGVAALVSVFMVAAFFAASTPTGAQPAQQGTTPFLTLPFEPSPSMNVLSGWYYSGSGGFHGGIDYIHGKPTTGRGWQTFRIIASADGEACGNCSSRQGNAVWIKHKINGVTYYTYYGHLASISTDIPLGSQSRTITVKRGQFLGMAGDTGSGKGAIHLHYGLYTAGSQPIDPYGVGKLREAYPAPHSGQPGIGWFLAQMPADAVPSTGGTQPPANEPAAPPANSPDTGDIPKSDEDPHDHSHEGEGGGGEPSTYHQGRKGPMYIGVDFSHLAY